MRKTTIGEIQMHNFKMCERCNNAVISNLNSPTADYYRHLSVKYCDKCREIVKREQTAERVKRYRRRKKLETRAEQTRLELLERENELMKENYVQLCEKIELLQNLLQYRT